MGSHHIQGISDEFIPAIVKLDELDAVIQANDGDAIIMPQMLAKQLGLAVGISSGANNTGAIKIKEKMGLSAKVVTLLCDSKKKILKYGLSERRANKRWLHINRGGFTGCHTISR